jgi:hypothetical protein
LLAKIHQIDLLSQLYEEVFIPISVWDEVKKGSGREVRQIQPLLQTPKIQLRKATNTDLERVSVDLGSGEREAIALAIGARADLVILDEQKGRRVARERGLSVTGTIGILAEARERGVIPSVRHELDRLIEAGIWLDEAFYHRILEEFGE